MNVLRLVLVLTAGILVAPLSQQAHASAELAKAKNCVACHAADKTLVGPSYKDIAAKYAGDKDAETYLAKKIREGGTGVWFKDRVMTPMTNVSADEAKVLAKWVLSQK